MIKNHKADSFDGGRAPSVLPDAELPADPKLRLQALLTPRAEGKDDEVQALALAVLALTGGSE
jgi:hypothetical protein